MAQHQIKLTLIEMRILQVFVLEISAFFREQYQNEKLYMLYHHVLNELAEQMHNVLGKHILKRHDPKTKDKKYCIKLTYSQMFVLTFVARFAQHDTSAIINDILLDLPSTIAEEVQTINTNKSNGNTIVEKNQGQQIRISV